jgi:gliding motility-associated-like protein
LSLASQVILFRRSNTEKDQVEMGKNFVPQALASFADGFASFRLLVLLWVALSAMPQLWGQSVRNGGMEINQVADCGINLQNAIFNQEVSFITAFGGQGEVDVLSEACGFGRPPEGQFFLALYRRGTSDAVALDLSEPLLPGETYFLRLASRRGQDTFDVNSQLEVGLSMQADSFGTPVYLSEPLPSQWTYLEFAFEAPFAAAYVTIRLAAGDPTWAFVDDLSFFCPEVDLGPDTAYCEGSEVMLSVTDQYAAYQWSDGTTASFLSVQPPGTFWVEASTQSCRVRDSVYLSELNCRCPMSVPSAFTPNGDGYNDWFAPVVACALTTYTLRIYNRWGKQVFTSQAIGNAWDGSQGGSPAPEGVYVYLVQWQWFYDSRRWVRSGTVQVLR